MEQQPNNTPSNLAIQILTIIGGLLSASCFIGFLVSINFFRSDISAGILGVCLIIIAVIGNRLANQLFLETLITTLYVVGCSTLCYALANSGWHTEVICLLFILIGVLTFLLSKGLFFPFLSVILFNIAFAWLFVSSLQPMDVSRLFVLLPGGVFLLLNLFEAKLITSFPGREHLFRPLHAGFFTAFACGLTGMSGYYTSSTQSAPVWILSILLWLGIVLMLHQAMQAMKVKSTKREAMVYLVCLVFLVPTLFAPSLSGALLLLLLCFHYGYKVEMGVSLIAFIYLLIKYYYDLQFTLLTKSMALFATGAALLLVWYFFTKHPRTHEEL